MAPSISPSLLFALRLIESTALFVLLCCAVVFRGPPPALETANNFAVLRPIKVPRRGLIVFLLAIVALTAFLDGLVIVFYAAFKNIFEPELPAWHGIEFYSLTLLIAFGGFSIIGTFKEALGLPIWRSTLLKLFVFVALVFEIALAALIPLVVSIRTEIPVGIAPALHFYNTVFRAVVLLVLFATLFSPRIFYVPIERNVCMLQTGETPLLTPIVATEVSTDLATSKLSYSTFPVSFPTSSGHTRPPAPGFSDPPVVNDKPTRIELSWSEIGTRLKHLWPYLWFNKGIGMKFLVIICLLIIGTARAINAVVPFKLGEIIDALNKGNPRNEIWSPLFWYISLKFLQRPGGLGALRDIVWAPILQHSSRAISQLAFNHLLNLSHAWHTAHKTDEIVDIVKHSTGIGHLFELLAFGVVPALADLVIALYIFFWYFGPALSLVIGVTIVLDVILGTILTTWWTTLNRRMHDVNSSTSRIRADFMPSYEAIKYFGGEGHERERRREALSRYQGLEMRVIGSLNIINLSRSLLLSVGLLIGSFIIVADTVHPPEQILSRYIIFVSYLTQLYDPLNCLANTHYVVNQVFAGTERLIELLHQPLEVKDLPGARELVVTDGIIEFDNVTFSYDGRTKVLNGVSFTIPKGASIALVGEPGSGKSTIFKLLYRFYDLAPGNGAIRIDGQDIRNVTLASLRKAIGVVPQDSMVFSNTIAYNIGYGKFGASAREIECAARAAQLHEKVVLFPDGYRTRVGERGMQLNDSEKQRVAIARTLLKAPPIVLLEAIANSEPDTNTEWDTQQAIQHLTDGRSSMSIVYQLPTTANSDLILVLRRGEIVESGTLRQLLAQNSHFAAMWADQIRTTGVVDNSEYATTPVIDAAPVALTNVESPEPDGGITFRPNSEERKEKIPVNQIIRKVSFGAKEKNRQVFADLARRAPSRSGRRSSVGSRRGASSAGSVAVSENEDEGGTGERKTRKAKRPKRKKSLA